MGDTNLSAYLSPDRTLLATAASDGGIRVVDAASGLTHFSLTGGLATGKSGNGSHLDLPTELQERIRSVWWFQTAEGPADTQADAVSRKLLVLGTSEGTMAAVDTTTAEICWRGPNCHAGAVAAITGTAPSQARSSLYTVGADLKAVRLDPRTGKSSTSFKAGKGTLTCAVLSHGMLLVDSTRLLVGGSSLVMWGTEEQKRLLKFSGHSANVQAMAFSPNDVYAVTAAHAERHVVIWHTAAPASKKRQQAAGLVSLEHAVVHLSTHSSVASRQPDADAGHAHPGFQVAALTSEGAVHIWNCTQGKEHTVKATLQAHISVNPVPGVQHARILAAAYATAESLFVAHGSSIRPSFEHVSLPSALILKDKHHAKIALQPSQDGVLLPASATAARQRPAPGQASAQAAIIAPYAMEDLGLAIAAVPALQKPSKRRREGEDSEHDAAVKENGVMPNGVHEEGDAVGMDTDEEDGQPTLGEQLAAMGILPRDEELQDAQSEDALLPEGPPSLQADSLVTLLTQALHSQDKQLLERCLAVGELSVITKTIRGLAPADAGQLLTAAVQRLQSKPARGQQLTAWLRPLLLHHAGYLMASPGAQTALAGLYQTIEARLAMQRPLASLAGRLDLLCAQMPSAAAAHARLQQQPFGGPQVVVHDTVVVEDAMAPNGYPSDDEDPEDQEDMDDSELSE